MKNKEIEIHRRVKDPAKLMDFLNKNADQIVESITQVDVYYTPAHEDYTKKDPIEKWFRLRSTDRSNSLDFKHWSFDKSGKSKNHCDEYVLEIKDVESAEKLLNALDFKKVVVVEKRRSIWMYNQIEISIDEVKHLGKFVELEAKGEKPIEELLKELENLADKLELIKDSTMNLGYPILLLNNEEAKSDTE